MTMQTWCWADLIFSTHHLSLACCALSSASCTGNIATISETSKIHKFCSCESVLSSSFSLSVSVSAAWGVWAGGHGGPGRGNAGARRGDIWWNPAGNQPTRHKAPALMSQCLTYDKLYDYIVNIVMSKVCQMKKKNIKAVGYRQRWVHSHSGCRLICIHQFWWLRILAVLHFNSTPHLPPLLPCTNTTAHAEIILLVCRYENRV